MPELQVDEASASLVDEVGADRLVALGGGRVIDSAKAVASVTGAEVAAIPTTLSGAPITGFHRLPAGRESEVSGFNRPALVLAYADAMTSAPELQLRATAMNALAHGADSLFTPLADPLSRETALRGAELIAGALDQLPEERDRSALALGALLCAIAVDRAGFALHHVLGQTTVRVLGVPHAETYAALLPRTMEAMRPRAPEQIEALAEALATDPDGLEERIDFLAGQRRIGELGADPGRIDEVVEVAMARPELARMTPGRGRALGPGRDSRGRLVADRDRVHRCNWPAVRGFDLLRPVPGRQAWTRRDCSPITASRASTASTARSTGWRA